MAIVASCNSKLYEVDLPPEILARGFWLYIWKIVGPAKERFCYVGMTGDVTAVAQSPFARAGGHFSSNKQVNAVRRHLLVRGIEPESCRSMKFLVYGPVFPYVHTTPRHENFDESRLNVAALERRLWNMARGAGFQMLNGEPNGKAFDETVWARIADAFEPHLENDQRS